MSLRDEFKDREYRRAYAESFANTIIATQNRLLRGKMTQKEFADLVGIKQSRVSAMEDENYSAWSTKTLKRLAAAKDVVFVGRYISFSDLIAWSRDISEESLTVVPFEQDATFHIESLFAKARAARSQARARIDNSDELTLTEQSKVTPIGRKVSNSSGPSQSVKDATGVAVAV